MAARNGKGRFVSHLSAIERFRLKCCFEADTGCVVWTGGQTQGRGHHVPYGSFWFEGRRWFAHRWAAKYVHGLDIEGFDVDHCCPLLTRPNTLCVEHVQALTPARNRELQTMRNMIHLQVGLITYDAIYGPLIDQPDLAPFFTSPAWLGPTQGPTHDHDCPF